MVEIKSRKRATSPAMASSFTRRDDWLDPISPDAPPQRDVHEGLTVGRVRRFERQKRSSRA